MKSQVVGDLQLHKIAKDGGQKKWLVKGVATLAMLGGIAAAPDVLEQIEPISDKFASVLHMKGVSAASVAKTINEVTDANEDAPRTTAANSSTGTTNFTGYGTSGDASNPNKVAQKGTTSWWTMTTGGNQSGKLVYNTALDTDQDFTVTGSIYARDNFWQGDFVGIFVAPQLPATIGNNGGPGSGLGIYGNSGVAGIKNATALGGDMNKAGDATYGDPDGEYPAMVLRQTDANAGVVKLSTFYSSAWQPGKGTATNATVQGTGTTYTLTYDADAGTNGRGILTLNMAGKQVYVQIDKTQMPYLPVGVDTTGGSGSWTLWEATMDVKGQREAIPVNVTYKDTAGNQLLDPTSITIGDGQSLGITGVSTGTTSDTITYNAPVIPGYYASTANTVSAHVNDNNTYNYSSNVVYTKSPQQATVTKTGLHTSNAVKNETVTAATGSTGGTIAIADASLAVSGYSYIVTAPDGSHYSTMSEALAAGSNGVFDSTTNSSGASDAAIQNFGVSYSALSQKASFSYSGGTPLSGAPTVVSGVTDDRLPGSLYVYTPSGYRLDSANTSFASGIGMTSATTMRSATITGTFDADTATDQNSTIVLKADKQTATLKQVINATTSDVESVTGGTDSKIAFAATDSTLAKTGYTYNVTGPDGATYDTLTAALAATPNYDKDNNDGDTDAKAQVFTVNYTDTQAPTISTGKDSYQVTTGAGTTADSFLTAINAQVSDNQVDGSATLTSDYADVVKDEPGTYTVTLTATDATGLKTTKTITVVVMETSPYDQESAVSSAASNLETISNDPTKTTADVQAAQKALDDAIATAKSNRETAKTNAETAEKNATDQGVADDSTVVDAQKALDDAIAAADNNTGTTQAIVDATNALDHAVAVASANAVATTPVSQETAVASAKDNLDKVLADSALTTDQIIAARDALKDAVNDALEARNDALSGADTALDKASQSVAALDPDVIAAQQALQDAVANANADTGTTAAVTQATEALNKAISDAESEQETARAAAAAAIAAMTPVSNEANILAAYKSLQDILDNQNATADEITNATTALKNETTTEKGAREDTVSAANTDIETAQAGDNANDEGVKAAIENLQNIIADATNEKPDNDGNVPLTADIENATKALAQAIADAASAREDAVTAAQDMMSDTTPISLEPETTTAKNALQSVLDDPKATATDIEEAMQDFKDAIDAVREERSTADEAASDAIATAQDSDYADEKDVQDAIVALKEAQENAAGDTGMTAKIEEAMTALQDALAAAESEQQKAIADAQAVATSPVSHEADVVDAQKALDDLIASAESGGMCQLLPSTKLHKRCKMPSMRLPMHVTMLMMRPTKQ
ncbi:hypothetical protein BKY29_03090 [Weissella confusa]|uniref:beta strand repeat-containing protein n=1 Tax=Weissella confusa TaxID=1583 RepID=UPI0008FDF587|nr:hypothetical protein [Weissella confusa]OJF03999.1 hypothetical protein BKY29_03090 [Weissella confusa]